jgi:hypothetical protein
MDQDLGLWKSPGFFEKGNREDFGPIQSNIKNQLTLKDKRPGRRGKRGGTSVYLDHYQVDSVGWALSSACSFEMYWIIRQMDNFKIVLIAGATA